MWFCAWLVFDDEIVFARYDLGKVLGKGGFGQVYVVTERLTGREYACKSIAKRLDVPNLSPQKQAAYLDNIRREVMHLSVIIQ